MKLENKLAELTQKVAQLEDTIETQRDLINALEKFFNIRLNCDKDGFFYERKTIKYSNLTDLAKQLSYTIPIQKI